MPADPAIEAIDAALCREYGWQPLSDAAKAAITESVANAPTISEVQRLRIARMLRGSLGWNRAA